MGWWRTAKYYRFRIIRLTSPASTIASNLAAGSAMSFTPFFGAHIFGAMGIGWLMAGRANIVAATVGTFVGNPWTFPFLLYVSHYTGVEILNLIGIEGSKIGFTPDVVEEQGDNLFAFVWDNFTDVFVPTAIGGTVLAVLSYPFYYALYYNIVRGAQRARRLRLRKKQRELFNRKSGHKDIYK